MANKNELAQRYAKISGFDNMLSQVADSWAQSMQPEAATRFKQIMQQHFDAAAVSAKLVEVTSETYSEDELQLLCELYGSTTGQGLLGGFADYTEAYIKTIEEHVAYAFAKDADANTSHAAPATVSITEDEYEAAQRYWQITEGLDATQKVLNTWGLNMGYSQRKKYLNQIERQIDRKQFEASVYKLLCEHFTLEGLEACSQAYGTEIGKACMQKNSQFATNNQALIKDAVEAAVAKYNAGNPLAFS